MKLTGAQVGMGGEGTYVRRMIVPDVERFADTGWEDQSQQRIWVDYVKSVGALRDDMLLAFTAARYPVADVRRPVFTRRRADLIEDAQWRQCNTYNEYRLPIRLTDQLNSFAHFGVQGRTHGFALCRPPGDRGFDVRERRIAHLVHMEMLPLLTGTLARDASSGISLLTPRLRQTLACLLEGDTELQAAQRLHISPHTLHEYVTRLYRHFGVHSRSELLFHVFRRTTETEIEHLLALTPRPSRPRRGDG